VLIVSTRVFDNENFLKSKNFLIAFFVTSLILLSF